jgi:hypothetical protein
VILAFFSGKDQFDAIGGDIDSPINILNKQIKGLSPYKVEILKFITEKSNNLGVNLISFKNFENLVLHSLKAENYQITIKTKTIHKMCKILWENSKDCSLLMSLESDSLFKWIAKINPKELSKLNININLVLKTKLLAYDDKMEVSRCSFC